MDDESKIGLPHPLFLGARPQFDGDMGKMAVCIASKSTDAADEIKQLRARNQELEARLQKLQSDYEAVGAGDREHLDKAIEDLRESLNRE